MNRVRTACAIVIQSCIRRLLAIKQVQKICEERGLNPSFSSKSAGDAGFNDLPPSRVQHIAAIIIQIHVRVFLSKMNINCANETARSLHKGRITSAHKKSVTMLYSGEIPTELNDSATMDTTLDTTFDESLPGDEPVKCDDWEGVVRCKQVRVGLEGFPDAKTKALITARWQPENVTSKEMEAAITIQCFARVICSNNTALALLDECLEEEEEDAAIILQCWIRRILARWKLLALRNGDRSTPMTEFEAVITLQCFARVLSANKKALLLLDEVLDKEEKAAAIVLQCWCRQLLKERGVCIASTTEYNDEEIASVKIQAAVRKFLSVTDYHKHIDAAIVLQCFARVLLANQRAALLLDELLDQEEEKAAIVIQRWVRQVFPLEAAQSLMGGISSEFVLSLLKQRRSSTEREQRAADECWSSIGSSTTKSVGLVRTIAKGHMGDKDITGAGASSNSQLDTVQSSLFRVVEPQQAVRTKEEIEEAIITLQCFVRVIAANAKAAALLDNMMEKEENDAAIVIQCWIRQCRAGKFVSFLSRVEASSRGDAAIRIQSIVRCYLAQKKFRNARLAKGKKSTKRTLLKNKFEQPENSKVSFKHREHVHLEQQEKQEQSMQPKPMKRAKRVKKSPWWTLFFSCLRPQTME